MQSKKYANEFTPRFSIPTISLRESVSEGGRWARKTHTTALF